MDVMLLPPGFIGDSWMLRPTESQEQSIKYIKETFGTRVYISGNDVWFPKPNAKQFINCKVSNLYEE